MATPNPVNWFEIPVTDMARARTFYESVFECQLSELPNAMVKMLAFPMEQGAPGATGALIQIEHCPPSMAGTTVYFHVACIDEAIKRITAAGGGIVMPRTSIGPYGFIAQFTDTEGNRVALHQMPEAGDCQGE